MGSLKGYKILVDGQHSEHKSFRQNVTNCLACLDMQFLCKPAKSKSCIVPGLESGSIHQFGV